MQPPAMTGVPVKSPSPPPSFAEKANTLVRVGTTVVVSVFSAGCDRVFSWSWPYDDHSPPGRCAGAQVAGRAVARAVVRAPAAGTTTANAATIGSQRRDPTIRRLRSC